MKKASLRLRSRLPPERLVGGDELGAERPGPALLPDRRGFSRDQPLEPRRIAPEAGIIAAAGFDQRQHRAVPLPGIGAAERKVDRLLLRSRDRRGAKRALGRKQVAMLPRALDRSPSPVLKPALAVSARAGPASCRTRMFTYSVPSGAVSPVRTGSAETLVKRLVATIASRRSSIFRRS